jgi:ABC-2 type transport system ATP-binding protein
MNEAAIETEGLVKTFGEVRAVDGVDMVAREGTVFGLLGPNGAGKTTAIRILLDLIRPTAGRAFVLGFDCQRQSMAVRERIGYLPGDLRVYESMHGAAFLDLIDSFRPEKRDAAFRRELCDRMGLDVTRPIRALSKGNRQKLGIVQALMHRPELLVLDEPFAGLDPLAVQTLAEVLRGESARGAAVLFSSHQLDLVEDICEAVAIVDHGRVVATGDVDALRRRSPRRRIELQLDDASAQWLPGVPDVELVERRDGTVRLLASRTVDPGRVLAAAQQGARVVSFSYGPPTLAELFLELVAP